MFRRVLLAISFVAALGVAGFVATDSAEAHGCRRGGYGGYHGAYYGGGYGGYYPQAYRTNYYPPVYYGGGYGGGYGGHGHCHNGGGSYFSIGF